MPSFLNKVELKKQLQEMGISVEGNYVRKKDIEQIYSHKYTTVYRLEDKDGYGPFRSKLQPRGQWIGSPTIHTANEFSEKDKKIFDSKKHLFGFVSVDDAKKYFEDPNNRYAKGDWQRLLDSGFHLKKYFAKFVFYGKHMVFFEPFKHKLLS